MKTSGHVPLLHILSPQLWDFVNDVVTVILFGGDGITEEAERLERGDGGEGVKITEFRDQVVRQHQRPQLRKTRFQVVGDAAYFVVAAHREITERQTILTLKLSQSMKIRR